MNSTTTDTPRSQAEQDRDTAHRIADDIRRALAQIAQREQLDPSSLRICAEIALGQMLAGEKVCDFTRPACDLFVMVKYGYQEAIKAQAH